MLIPRPWPNARRAGWNYRTLCANLIALHVHHVILLKKTLTFQERSNRYIEGQLRPPVYTHDAKFPSEARYAEREPCVLLSHLIYLVDRPVG